MSTGRRLAKAKGDNGFTVRTVMAMANEMAEARARMNRVCIQFDALAASVGVKVDWEDHTA